MLVRYVPEDGGLSGRACKVLATSASTLNNTTARLHELIRFKI